MNTSHHIKRRVLNLCLLGGLGLAPAGCLTTEQMAPPVESLAPSVQATGVDLEQLKRGRHIYLTDCARCHAVEPIDHYSRSEWLNIMPDMAEESELTPDETDDVETYVLTAHEYMRLNSQANNTSSAR